MEGSIRQWLRSALMQWAVALAVFFLGSWLLKRALIEMQWMLQDPMGGVQFAMSPLKEMLQDPVTVWISLFLLYFVVTAFYFSERMARPFLEDVEQIEEELRREDVDKPVAMYELPAGKVRAHLTELDAVLCALRDSRARRNQAEEHVRETNARVKEQIAYLNHDLKTPLSIVLANTALIRRENLEPAGARQLQRIENSAREMLQQLDQMNDLVSSWMIQEQEMSDISIEHLQNQLIDVAHLHADSFEYVLDVHRDQGHYDSATDSTPIVHTNLSLFKKTLRQLLDNAYRYGGGTKVELRFAAQDGVWRLSLRDAGVGFENVDRASELFWTQNVGRASREGYGMGLTFAKAFAESCEGELTLENREEGGAQVTLALPYQA